MTADELRSLQGPLKAQYRERPETALVTLTAEGKVGEKMTCKIETGKARVEAGLHPATGGDGQSGGGRSAGGGGGSRHFGTGRDGSRGGGSRFSRHGRRFERGGRWL